MWGAPCFTWTQLGARRTPGVHSTPAPDLPCGKPLSGYWVLTGPLHSFCWQVPSITRMVSTRPRGAGALCSDSSLGPPSRQWPHAVGAHQTAEDGTLPAHTVYSTVARSPGWGLVRVLALSS